MIKAMIMLTRRADMSHEEFVSWWLDEHVPLASGLPDVRKVVLNVVDEGYDEAGFDGVSELWFDSRADFDSAYASEIGKATAADSMAHVSGRVRVFVSENEFVSTK
ncbi:MAG: EthD family reductase [Actinomycetes bacterium]